MKLHTVTLLPDNYIWLLSDTDNYCVIVDPGSAEPICQYLDTNRLKPRAILLTHHHSDHIAGALPLQTRYPDCVIYAPKEISQLAGFSQLADHQLREVIDTDKLIIGDFHFDVIGLPGHTLGHVAYYSAPYLFCGDTLFSAGCGRIFEGTPAQMYTSIMKLAELPDQTLVCCGHEFTLSNLMFAHHLLPEDPIINHYIARTKTLRTAMQPTIPSTIKEEKQINLFLRSNDSNVQKAIGLTDYNNDFIDVFAKLRELKNRF